MAIETEEERQALVDLGARIRASRADRRLTLADLALRCGLPRSALSEIENGKRDIRISSLFRISAALGVPMDALLRKGRPPSPTSDDGYDFGDLV
ncbi:helix-turn-helix domain-containing protein [Salipiger sp. P9]|uniref:helix-turn-helix domain-containing protein n=1 Tax=Salipiger pentaromativorans TaxID=2943193 RepID=UPI002157BE28|nr:helix-turn-helix transcriptional regulator [Salipiger pentaromativorans]MCR8549151.1 helix-turn-helix domain-containing protein [Salipiger pentaromativorans]